MHYTSFLTSFLQVKSFKNNANLQFRSETYYNMQKCAESDGVVFIPP